MTPGEPVRADGLRREFGDTTALDGVDLTLADREVVGIAGPNGSGKTTLIRTLLGTLRPTAGTVRVYGTEPTSFTRSDRARLGYMPQRNAVYRDLTVAENVAFFARLYRVDHVDDAVERTLSFVDLTHRRDARIGELSGGMVRRTSLACAIVHDPEMLFLDEPTVGLDPELRATMWDGFRQQRDRGSLILVSTHYLGEARHCDRVLFLRDGRVLAFDAPEVFLARTNTDDLEDAFLALLGDDVDETETEGTGTTEELDGTEEMT